MFPFFVCLFDLNDMSEKSTVYFGKHDLVTDNSVNPIFFVLKGQVKDEAPTLSELFFKLVVDEIQNILLLNRLTVTQIFDDALFNGCEPSSNVSFLISFGWVFLKELDPLEHFIDCAFHTDVNKVVFDGDGSGQSGFPRFWSADDE